MLLFIRFKKLLTTMLALGAAVMFVPEQAHSAVLSSWCTHSTAQRLEGDVNGDRRPDAVCHDKVSGTKWVALAEATGLEERWTNDTLGWCSHAGATLFIGDVNGDSRADLVCKDPARVWVDYAGDDFYAGTDYVLDTTWCTHPGALTFVGDQNSDGQADLVCRGSDGFVWIDRADSLGQFGGTDVSGLRPDFELRDIIRIPATGTYTLVIRNNGSAGSAEYFRCSTNWDRLATVLRIPPGWTREVRFTYDNDHAVVTCSVEGRGEDGSAELFVSNNQLRKRVR